VDAVTHDRVIGILGDEEDRRPEFLGIPQGMRESKLDGIGGFMMASWVYRVSLNAVK
jgi:hypothetical protein